MQEVTVGPKYQVVIPKAIRVKLPHLRPGTKVRVELKKNRTISVHADPTSWVARAEGIMSDAWKDIDPIAEVEKMRDEWEERMNELEQARQ